MWEALVFSKEIVLVFSKVGASRRIQAHPAPYPAPLSEMGHRSGLELQRSGISAVSGVTGEGEGEGGEGGAGGLDFKSNNPTLKGGE